MEESKEKVSMSEEKGKISVIVPVYQAEKYLAKALDSVISQDYENWELFLLVRKSSDQSEKIVRDYEKKYDSIHMIERGENKAGEARNQGLEKAQGEYVLFLDSDDYLPDASVMQRYVRMAEQTDADIVVANYSEYGNIIKRVDEVNNNQIHLVSDNKNIEYTQINGVIYETKGISTWVDFSDIYGVVIKY